eukprot:PhF_6_TR21934/c0_g1_i2/m.31166/K10712/ADO; cysteamine dioxygenase
MALRNLMQVCRRTPHDLPAVHTAMKRVTYPNDIAPLMRRVPLMILRRYLFCLTFDETPEHTLVAFFVPPGGVMPLHDHPNMNVFLQVMKGDLHVRSMDWIDKNTHRAKIVFDGCLGPQSPILHVCPNSGGVLHEITSKDGGMFLDFITPPYSEEKAKPCTYYEFQEVKKTHSVGDEVFLTPLRPPPEVVMYSLNSYCSIPEL